MEKISSAAFTDTKPHYDLLDGLRGVAALMVIWYHVFEGFAFASAGNIETLNHGYLAVKDGNYRIRSNFLEFGTYLFIILKRNRLQR